MNTVGIIAEYDPFHNGHLYHIQEAKRLSCADYVIVIMSPDFTQRGEPALLDKWARAAMALECGADLVLELPVRYATGSAEYFAFGAVSTLSALGVVNSLSFGCEAGEEGITDRFLDDLHSFAEFLSKEEPAEYASLIRQHLKSGKSYAMSRCLAYLTHTGKSDPNEFLRSPNNILAIEYIRAILKTGADITILPVTRTGAGYHDKTHDGSCVYASATGIRHALKNGDDVRDLMPFSAWKILDKERKLRRFLTPSDLDLPLHLALTRQSTYLSDYADVSADLSNRIRNLLPQYLGFDQFTELLKTRQVTYTRVRRALLHILLEIRNEPISPAPYARILGFRKNAEPLLHRIKSKTSVPVITKLPQERFNSRFFGEQQDQNTAPASSLLLTDALEEDLRAAQLWELLVSHKTGIPALNEHQRRLLIQDIPSSDGHRCKTQTPPQGSL